MKTAIPWILVLALAGGVYFLYSAGGKKDAEIAQLQQQTYELEQLRTDNAELKKYQNQAAELDRLRTESADLPGLRNQVQQMKDQVKDLTKKLSVAQAQSAQSQVSQQQLSQLSGENEALRARNQQVQQATAQVFGRIQINACLNNLRQIDGAKQQWALENNKTTGAVPAPADLLPYLPNNTMPVCPAGGVYTLNAVETAPSCNMPGHVLNK